MKRWLVLSLLLACEQKEPVDYGDPTDLNTPTSHSGITAYVVSPKVAEPIESSQLSLVVAAWLDEGPGPLRVTAQVGSGSSVELQAQGEDGPQQRYAAPLSLLHGLNRVRIRISTPDSRRVRFIDYGLNYSAAAPGLRLSVLHAPEGGAACEGVPLALGITRRAEVCVRGQVTVAEGEAVGLQVQVTDGAGAPVSLTTNSSGAFETLAALQLDALNTLSATVGESTAMVPLTQDSTPPLVSVEGGTALRRTADASISLVGTAHDEHGLASVWLESGFGGVTPLGASTNWTATVFLVNGPNLFTLRARDLAGNEASLEFAVERERVIVLRGPGAHSGGTSLQLDVAALSALLPNEADQKALALARVPLKPAIVSALDAIRDPVAAGLDTSAWGKAEWNLWELLNMTPDNAQLQGTSVEAMLDLADAIGIPRAKVLADVFDIDVLDTFVSSEKLGGVLLDKLMASHPNMRDGQGQPITDAEGNVALEISLYDALNELTTVAPRFGACALGTGNAPAVPACAGAHPGFLTGTSSAAVFEPGFLLIVPVKSNLAQYQGVAAAGTGLTPGASKDYLFRLHGDTVLELDFSEDGGSTVVGLVDEPKVNLSFLITEGNTPSCSAQPCQRAGTVKNAGADPERPGFFRGNATVWAAPEWTAEHIIDEVAYRDLHNRFAPSYQRTFSYDAGSIENAAVINWDTGWVTVTTAAGLGSPPPPLYAWDLLFEVAQVRAHDGLNEGEADTRFTLTQLPIGLTATQLVAQMRPTLQEKAPELSQRLIGGGGLSTSGVDIFFVPGVGDGHFYFRGADDVGDGGVYPYSLPGMFADAALTQKLSSLTVSGIDDVTHEKLAVSEGQAFYFRAPSLDGGELPWRLQVREVGEGSVSVLVQEVAQ